MELKEIAADFASLASPPPPPPPPPPPLPPPPVAVTGLQHGTTASKSGVEPDLCFNSSSPASESLRLHDVTLEEMETMKRTRKKMDCNRKTSIPDNTGQQQQHQDNSLTKIDSNSLTNLDKKGSTAIVAHQPTTSSSIVFCDCCSNNPSNNHQQQQQQQQQQQRQQQGNSHHHPHHHRNDCESDSREDPSLLLLLGNEDPLPSSSIFSADDNREFDFLLKAPLLPRSSSLKSCKTPSSSAADTPFAHRKSVRFADALGLDLELVRHILNPDEPPNVPLTATRFMENVDQQVISYWRVCFPHPSTMRNLLDRVLQEKVSLETCNIVNSNRKVYGTVRVANIAYEKRVCVRFSLNGWLTCEEVDATYIEHSNDLITDRFSFELRIPDHLVARSRMEFAIKFTAANKTFWDNNFTRNYTLQCVDSNNDL